MRHEAFYEICAQVIPTIFIAVVLELRALLGRTASRWEEVVVESPGKQEERRLFGQYATSAVLVLTSAAAFVISELCTLSVVFFGVSGWWPLVAVWPVAIGVVMLTIVAVVAPIWLDEIRRIPAAPHDREPVA
jgi:hypothetical protein